MNDLYYFIDESESVDADMAWKGKIIAEARESQVHKVKAFQVIEERQTFERLT